MERQQHYLDDEEHYLVFFKMEGYPSFLKTKKNQS